REACESGRVAQLPGFGETTQAKICTAIEQRAKHSGYFQFGQIAAEAESLRRDLATRPDVLQVDVAGSYRRRREIVRDVDLVVATKKPAAITEFFVKHALVESIIAQGPTKTSVRLRSGIQCDLRVVSSAEYPFALTYFTGSKEHNIELRSRALERGWTLNEYRLAPLPPDPKAKKKRSATKLPKVRDESGLYQAHGLDETKLRAQVAAIQKLNKKFDGFRLFAGIECDILRDGKLDFPDEILSELDFVVASIHSVFNLSEADMTQRIIRAMENRF